MTHTKVSEKPGQKMISSMQLQNRMKRSPNGLKGERKLGNSRVRSEEIQHILFVSYLLVCHITHIWTTGSNALCMSLFSNLLSLLCFTECHYLAEMCICAILLSHNHNGGSH